MADERIYQEDEVSIWRDMAHDVLVSCFVSCSFEE